MRHLHSTFSCAFAAGLVLSAAASSAGQTLASAAPAADKPAPASAKWKAPRTPDGRPDLGGVWANNNITPLERPKQWQGKALLTNQELAELKRLASSVVEAGDDAIFGDNLVLLALEQKKNATSRDGCQGRAVTEECVTSGNYNAFWLPTRDFYNQRTSLVIDPADGRIPALTPEAQQRTKAAAEHRRLHPADTPEDRPYGERCLAFGVPRIQAAYMSYMQLFQTPTYVAILNELGYETRIIPIDGPAHVSGTIRQWKGDSRGRWEGDTLVVETANFPEKGPFMGATGALRLVERFTRVGPDILNYEVTISDPKTWEKPWTILIPLKSSSDQVYEFACHEGNHGMAGILAGARAEERELTHASGVPTP
jgi:hypothetical protein